MFIHKICYNLGYVELLQLDWKQSRGVGIFYALEVASEVVHGCKQCIPVIYWSAWSDG